MGFIFEDTQNTGMEGGGRKKKVKSLDCDYSGSDADVELEADADASSEYSSSTSQSMYLYRERFPVRVIVPRLIMLDKLLLTVSAIRLIS